MRRSVAPGLLVAGTVTLAWAVLLCGAAVAQAPQGFALYAVDRDGTNNGLLIAEPVPGLPLLGSADWSPEGHRVAFDAVGVDRDYRHVHVVVYHVGGDRAGEVDDLGLGTSPCWSPDGTQLVVFTNPGVAGYSQPGVHTIDAEGNILLSYGPGVFPEWSPDGRYLIAQASFGVGGQFYLYNVDSGKQRVLSLPEGERTTRPTWGPDETVIIASQTPSDRRLIQYRIDTKEDTLVAVRTLQQGTPQEVGGFGFPAYCAATNEVFFTMKSEGGRGLFRLSLDEGAEPVQILPPTDPPTQVTDLTVSPDGQRVAYKTDAFYQFVE